MDISTFSNALFSLLTLTVLEIVLGIDNLVFIAAVSNRLAPHQQKIARRVGLLLALGTRLLLLGFAVWLMKLQEPWFSLMGLTFSGRDLLLLGGGLFLLYKGTQEIHNEFEEHELSCVRKFASLIHTILQIGIFDIIFSLDSVLTAIGLTQDFLIMAIAITIAVAVMMFCSEWISQFIKKNPSIRMLAWSLLLLISLALIADGLHFHIPRGYIYFAVCFSLFVETLNILQKRKNQA